MDKFIQRKAPRKNNNTAESTQPHKKARRSDIKDKIESDSNTYTTVKTEENEAPLIFSTEECGLNGLEAAIDLDFTATSLSVQEEDIETEHGEHVAARWAQGKSSLYVEAFNLALDTVLEYEAHLFDAKELEVFEQWRALEYQEQYLYIRLFLRKAAAWHRISSLPYQSDASDPVRSAEVLQRQLPLKATLKNEEADSSHLHNLPVTLEDTRYGDHFTFADTSSDHITSLAPAIALLSHEELKTLAKESKIPGKNKPELSRNLLRAADEQTGLLSLGITSSRRPSSTSMSPSDSPSGASTPCRQQTLLSKILALTGPCIRLTPQTFRLFERVHLVFYRSTQWTERSLTTIILAKVSRKNFPVYVVHRSATIFPSRDTLLEFEAALRLEVEADALLESGSTGFPRLLEMLDMVYPRWKTLMEQEKERDWMFETGEGLYLRRFSPAHTYTRLVHKGAYILGRVKEYTREHSLLVELLGQRLFHPARRGAWYQRKALLEERYMYLLPHASLHSLIPSSEASRKHWRQAAVETCELALQDNDCHVIYHYDLQKRLVKLERQLRIPKRLQHDFGHVSLRNPKEETVEGVQLRTPTTSRKTLSGRASTRTLWLDEYAPPPSTKPEQDPEITQAVTVEEMCLSWYRSPPGGSWLGYHAEGGIIRTLFAYLFFDILFLPVPNVFQTAFQTCPLDLFTDAFFAARAGEINRRLAEISNGGAPGIIRGVAERAGGRRTAVVGLNWDFDSADVEGLARCFPAGALAGVCRVMAEEYRVRGGGLPDLVLWREKDGVGECRFVEVKSANDRVSDTQRLWMHILGAEGVEVVVCRAVAREMRG